MIVYNSQSLILIKYDYCVSFKGNRKRGRARCQFFDSDDDSNHGNTSEKKGEQKFVVCFTSIIFAV